MNISLNRWINAQRIALAAYRVNLPLSKSLPHEPREYRIILEQSLSVDDSSHYKRTIDSLPPTTLELLIDIEDKNIHSRLRILRPTWQQALQRLTVSKQDEMSLIRAATTFAHLLMLSQASPTFMIRLGYKILSNSWRVKQLRNKGVDEDFKDLMFSLRHSTLNTEKKIEAIDRFYQSFFCRMGYSPQKWMQVENVLYHHLFCWPLLVLGGGPASPAFSLPVAINVYFDGKGGDNKPSIKGDDNRMIRVDSWREPLQMSITSAKRLWSSQHKNYGGFYEKVQTASVVFDFTYACEMLGNVKIIPKDYPLELDQRSMEVYFSQVILSRFLGYPLIPGYVTTGSFGDLTINSSTGRSDYEVDWPKGVRQKLLYVFKSHLFQRVVFPASSEGQSENRLIADFLQSHRHLQNIEINYTKYLRSFTDLLQPGPWRRNQYVRCPDVAWAIDNASQRLPEVMSKKVQSCLLALQWNTSPVLELPNDMSILDVAAALRHLDTSRYNKYLPLLSCAFLRVTQDEHLQRFWYTLWSLIGAPYEVQQQFYNSPTTRVAAGHLVAAFNQLTPSEADPRFRAPDLLIIIGTSSWIGRLPRANPLSAPLDFSLIIDELKSRSDILPVLETALTQSRPQTRIIIVPLDQPQENTVSVVKLERKDRNLLQHLSIFRFGFTQTMAAPILRQEGLSGEGVRQKLRDFVEMEHLRYAKGVYHIPDQIGSDSHHSNKGYIQALHHFNAALAYAPYLNKNPQTAINFYTAHQPHIVHEAQYHLEISKQCLYGDRTPKEDRNLYGKINAGILRIVQFYDAQGWHTILKLLDRDLPPEDAHILATEMIADTMKVGAILHPSWWAVAAQAAYQVWERCINNYGRFNPTVEDRRQIVVERYEAALQACAAFPTELTVNRIMVLTRYGNFLLQDARDDERIRLNDINHEAWELIQEHGDMGVAFPSWFERFGDLHTNHRKAESIYAKGVQSCPYWYTSWIKLVGASCCVSREKAEEVLETLKNIEGGRLFEDFSKGLRRLDADLTSQRHVVHLKDRIEKGYQLFQRIGVYYA